MNPCTCAHPHYVGINKVCGRCWKYTIAPSSTAPRPPSTGAAPAATAGESTSSPAAFSPTEEARLREHWGTA